MKKIVFMLSLMCLLINGLYAQEAKVAVPPFKVVSLDITCCGGGKTTFQKKIIHIVYNNAQAGQKMRVEDNAGNLIGSYTLTGNDYSTPCLSLTNGVTYKILFTNSLDVVFTGMGVTYKVAPQCPKIIKKVDTEVIEVPKTQK